MEFRHDPLRVALGLHWVCRGRERADSDKFSLNFGIDWIGIALKRPKWSLGAVRFDVGDRSIASVIFPSRKKLSRIETRARFDSWMFLLGP